jgi:hypothetical protein
MINYYTYLSNERFLCLDIPRKIEKVAIEKMSYAQSVSQIWETIPIKFENKKKKVSDFPYFDIYIPVLSEQALDCLHDLISPYVEILPLHIVKSKTKFYGLNVLKYYTLDLDRSKCVGDYFVKEGRRNFFFSRVEVCVFPNDTLPKASMFRVSQLSWLSKIYVSEEFKQIVESNKLTGLEFEYTLNYQTGPEKRGFVNFEGEPVKLDPADREFYESGRLIILK